MENVVLTDTGIRIGGQDYPLWSGSFHYWRSDPARWRGILEKISQMGFGMVESYVPWGVHEIAKGEYDFGSIDARKNLRGFLDLCRELNFFVFLRPGPHINAELDCFGFPERIVFNHRYMARSPYGTPVTYPYATRPFPIPSYAAPEFLDEVREYFDAVYEEIKDYLYPYGPVVALQSDNEYCHFFRDSAYILDYSEASITAYHKFLRKRYGSAHNLSEAYGGPVDSIEEVRAPIGFSRGQLVKCYDWVNFKERQITEMVGKIAAYWRGKGVNLPIYHNIAFQYYTPVDLVAMEKEAVDVAGMDIYLYQYQGKDIRRKMRYLAGTSKLAFVPEFISGVWFDNPKTPTVSEQRFITLYALMNGLKAVNFYMLVERDRWQGCPITVDGRIREEYFDFYRKLTQFVHEYGLNGHTRQPEALLLKNYELGRFQSMYSRADFSPLVSNAFVQGLEIPRGLFTPEPVLGLEFEHQARQHWSEEPWLDRLADRLTALGVDYNLSDSQIPIEEMNKYKTIYASSFECMGRELQQKLLDYLKSGGRLIMPCLPDRDTEQESCTILSDALAEEKSLRLIMDDGNYPVLERRLLLPQEGSPLEYMLHQTAKGKLLFAANPTEHSLTGSVALLCDVERGSPVWLEEGAAASFNEGLVTVTLPPYTVSVWEVEA